MSHTENKKVGGLTLVELMVVVAVLSILASIAYPLYTAQSQKARRADAKIVLENIALAQERFYTVNGRYSDDYTEVFVSTVQAEAAGLVWPCASATSCETPNGYYTITIAHATDDQDFVVDADAIGTQASDTDCANFEIDQLGQKTATDANSTNCW